MSVGRDIKRLREQAGLTISELAKATALDVGHLYRLEQGGDEPSAYGIDQMETCLRQAGVSEDDHHGAPCAPVRRP